MVICALKDISWLALPMVLYNCSYTCNVNCTSVHILYLVQSRNHCEIIYLFLIFFWGAIFMDWQLFIIEILWINSWIWTRIKDPNWILGWGLEFMGNGFLKISTKKSPRDYDWLYSNHNRFSFLCNADAQYFMCYWQHLAFADSYRYSTDLLCNGGDIRISYIAKIKSSYLYMKV